MRDAPRRGFAAIASWPGSSWARSLLTASLVALASGTPAMAQNAWIEDLASAVVRIKTHINPEGRTVAGSGSRARRLRDRHR